MIVVENKKDAGAPRFDFMIGPIFGLFVILTIFFVKEEN